MLTEKFGKFFKKRNKYKGSSQRRYNSRKLDSNASNFTYFEYGKRGHIQIECPNIQNKKKCFDRKSEKFKTRKAIMMKPYKIHLQKKVKKQIFV